MSRWAPWSSKSVAGRAERAAVGSTPIHSRPLSESVSSSMKSVPLPEIDTVLVGLGDQFVGLYLHGSLAAGDFNPARSDIDFVVVTAKVLPAATVAALGELHRRMVTGGSR